MINLIPPVAEKVLKREYVLRVGGIIGFLLGGVMVILTIALVPTYILIGAQISTSISQTENVAEDEAFVKADAEVRTTKNLLRQLTSPESKVRASEIVAEIRRIAPGGISFKTFSLSDASGNIEKVQVQGTATTREALASLRVAIESSAMFEKAEIPIADLARDTNLPFNVTVTPATVE